MRLSKLTQGLQVREPARGSISSPRVHISSHATATQILLPELLEEIPRGRCPGQEPSFPWGYKALLAMEHEENH